MSSVRRVLVAANYDEECEALRHFLQPQEESTTEQGLDLEVLSYEPPVLPCDGDDKGRNSSQSLLEDLLLYLIVRKLAATTDSAEGKVILGVDLPRLMRWEQCEPQQATEIKKFVKTLHGLLLKSEWNTVSISALCRVVKRLQDPLSRQHYLAFAFQILHQIAESPVPVSKAGQMSEMENKFFDEAVRLLLLGVTDLWSAIRKDCTKMAAAIAFKLSSRSHIEQFMDSLLCIAIGSRSVSADKSQVTAWTEREGALLALSVLLRSVEMKTSSHQVAATVDPNVSQVKDDIKGLLGTRELPVVKYRLGGSQGRHTLTQLPRCLVQTLKPVMYQCLRHDQLSVRQLSAQCLVEFSSLCEEPTRLLIFQEVISKLNRLNRNEKATECESIANADESELLDAFEAEGLLDVLARMAPCLPSPFLLKHWKFVFPTLEKYVMHIASSVRQKSSSVVRALALRSLAYDSVSLKLMVQMLVSLSTQLRDESGLSWQRKEGRLLSIDVQINVLGESLVECGSDDCKLLRWQPESTQPRQRRFICMWAHKQTHSATWVRARDGQAEEDHAKASLVHVISSWLEENNGQDGLSDSSCGFWQQILGGYIAQTKDAFESSQFELRRISRQVLPGLMRLVIWTDQLEFVSLTQLVPQSVETEWSWMCVKFIVLHLRYLEESTVVLGETGDSLLHKLATNWETVWQSLLALTNSAPRVSIDTETTVTQAEVEMMTFLRFGALEGPPRQVTMFLDSALRSIHRYLPATMQLQTEMKTESADHSLDRQLCVLVVPILPVIVRTLENVSKRQDSSSSDSIQSSEVGLSSSFRWLCLERMVLTWLLCDDMFRWITLSKSEAQSQLLESLRLLLHFSQSDLSPTEEGEEVGRIIQCLQEIVAASQAKGTRLKDTNYTLLMDIYLQLWLRCLQNNPHYTDKIVIAVIQLYTQRQHYLALSDAKMKPCLAAESWDDWDDEDQVQRASPLGDIQKPLGLSHSDFLFQNVLESLDARQLNLLYTAARSIPDLVGIHDTSLEHLTQFQQQIGASVHT